ncbi:LOW QUALITY PROTEIN: aspartyl-tRNA(Asn) amidotransferase subunit A [Psychrobacter sp. JCM 18901]|nr:LOW QUALITY PROTEIN: aspartyl-tRNA(Asn) amidotransferase subunit A [Psychrobacter sp. JCM 18901]
MSELHLLSTEQLITGLQNKQFSSAELTEHYIKRIDALDSKINSFITHTSETARAQAKAADEMRAQGDQRPLLGVPMAHKDIFCTQGVLTTCGSKMLHNFVSPYDATIVSNIDKAGMISLGKLNMDEFAMGSDNSSSYYGTVQNPWNLERVPGGSSGGSAAAVAAGFVPVATGSDTGGSIRQPASFCGLTGIKPTYGRVSRFGMIAYASSLDQAGSMGRSAKDCAYLLQPMIGHDPRDATSIKYEMPDYVQDINDAQAAAGDKPFAGLRIGVAKEYFGTGLDSEVEQAVRAALKKYEELGATIVEVNITDPEITLATYYMLAPAEASSNLSRFDGVRFGYRCENPTDLIDLYTRSRSEGFGLKYSAVSRELMRYLLAILMLTILKHKKIRRLIVKDFDEAFASCDVIASPTAPTAAYKLTDNLDPATMYLGDVYTIAVNLAGLPALSQPVGLTTEGLPIGLQLIGKHWQESQLLTTAHLFQQHTDHHLQHSTIAKETV